MINNELSFINMGGSKDVLNSSKMSTGGNGYTMVRRLGDDRVTKQSAARGSND